MSRPRSGWNESLGGGLRRDHRVACTSTTDRRAKRACGCPYSTWIPDPSKREGRTRARIDGAMSLADARRERHRILVEARDRVARGELAAPAASRADNVTLRAWAKRCFELTWAGLAPRTIETRERAYRLRIDPHLGAHTLAELTPLVVDTWLRGLVRSDGQVRAVEHAAECLRALCGVAVSLELTDRNPVRHIPRTPKDSPSRRGQRVLSRNEYASLLAACRSRSEQALVQVACECGLRRGELAALRWSDLDLGALRINVTRTVSHDRAHGLVLRPRKGGRPARPAMSDALAQLLRDWHVECVVAGAGPDDPVWAGRGTRNEPYDPQTPMAPSSISHAIARIVTRAGLVDDKGRPLYGPHDLRRTGASLAVEAGVPVSVVQEQLGHSTPDVTLGHYVRRSEDAQQDRYAAVFGSST